MPIYPLAGNQSYEATFRELVEKHLAAAKWCAFWPMVGPEYPSAPKKLLVCGRALNGWDDTIFSCEQDASDLVARCERSFGPSDGEDHKLGWVEARWGQGAEYRTSRSAFWRVVRDLAGHLGYAGSGWTRHIAWTNVMRVSPAKEGNPEDWSWQAQLPHAAQLLAHEVEILQPDVLVFLVGKSWFGPLRDQHPLKDFLKPEAAPLLDAKHVSFVGSMGGTRVVVGPHPQGKPEGEIVKEIALAMDGC